MFRKKRKIQKKYSNINNLLIIRIITNKWFLFSYLLIITLITIVLHLFMQTTVNEISSYINHTKKIEQRIKQHIIEVETDITQLSRADRIQRIAKKRLNMINSKPQIDVIVIK